MNNRTLITEIDAALREDIRTADRISGVITRTVPWQFPGRLLQIVTELSPHTVAQSQATHAVIAVEYACLHQFLHAVPRTQQPLISPVSKSPYATNSIAAILDGDSLQACAFSRLDGTGEDTALIEEYYEHLAGGSIACYEQESNTSHDSAMSHLSPLAGVAAYIAARLGGFSQTDADSLKQAATALGKTLPVHTPSTRQHEVRDKTREAATTVIELLGGTQTATERINALLDAERTAIQAQQ